MKIALCLTGLPRSYRQGYEYIHANLLSKYDTDVFFHTWITDDCLDLIQVYNPKSYLFEKPLGKLFAEKYTRISNPNFPAYNTASSFYSVFNSILLKRKYELSNDITYDFVVRCRFDMALNFVPDFNESVSDLLYVPDDLTHIGSPLISDHFAYGSSKIIDRYSMTFLNLDMLYESGVRMNSEEMCTANIELNSLKVRRISMNNPFPPDQFGILSHSFIRGRDRK